jgi:molybdopterin-guanine dinucleotide biosynthesis protein A
MDYNSILGVVLAGGQSKRFGQDKTQVQLGEKILIDYILTEIVSEFNEILIVANNDIQFLNSKKITKVEDYKKDLGPLGGVLTAMRWIKHNKKNYKWIATFPSDTPFFSKKYLHNFIKNANDQQSKLFFVKSNDKRHNIFGLWSVELLDQLEEDLIKANDLDETYPSRGFLDDMEYSTLPLDNSYRRVVFVKDRAGYTAPRGAKLLCRYDTDAGFYEPVSKPSFIVKGSITAGSNQANIEMSFIQGKKKADSYPSMLVNFENPFDLPTTKGKGLFTYLNGKWTLTTS